MPKVTNAILPFTGSGLPAASRGITPWDAASAAAACPAGGVFNPPG
ncbi:MAG: hypothetical protein U0166_16625 [Acidobacteriota bacterium]